MTNGSKYKTAKERAEAFKKWCEDSESNWCHERCCDTCALYWLDLEAKEEKIADCPCCGGKCIKVYEVDESYAKKCKPGWFVHCYDGRCNYSSGIFSTRKEAIDWHNRVAKKCMEGKE